MPIPPFDDDGLLPAGIYIATLDEVIMRFGGPSAARQVIGESLQWAVDAARRAGVARFIIDGSFVDDRVEPNDADCVLLFGADYPRDAAAARELDEGIPYVQLITFEDAQEFEAFIQLQFMTDRLGRSRGVIEVSLT